MAVEKMQFAMPMAAGYEAFTFTPFQAEKVLAEAFIKAKAEAEADEEKASLKAKAEKEAALIVKAWCGSKRKAKEDREEKVLAEAFIKAKAETKADEEKAFIKAKAEEASLIVKAGCGSGRKAEEDREEAPAAVGVMVQWNGEDASEDEFCKACMADYSIDYDSDDCSDECYAKCKASFERCMDAWNARYPLLFGEGKVADADVDGSLVE